jgi:PhnB protein
MSLMYKPEGYQTAIPYLIVEDVRGLLSFIQSAFSGTERSRAETPDGGILHAEAQIGDSVIMMGESNEQFRPFPGMVHLYLPDVDQTYRLALDAGAVSIQEPTDQFYGDRTAGVRDRFGNVWWLATRVRVVSEEEIERHLSGGA